MKHYPESEWLAFKQHEINTTQAAAMEDHLLECDQCLNLFLNLTGELETAHAKAIIPPDFSRTTMRAVKQQKIPRSGTIRGRDRIKRLFSYYVAAAAVTLILAGGGFFETIVSDPGLVTASSAAKPEYADSIIYTWPNRLLETSSQWTDLIPQKSKNIKEVIWW